MRKISVLAAVFAVGLATAACDIQTSANGNLSFDIAAGKATDTWSRTYKLGDKQRFELINVNGRITAEPTDGAEVIVEGKRTAKAMSDEKAREVLAQLEIREEAGDSSVRVESRPPRRADHEIEWTVKVPKGVVVDLRTINGGVRMNNLSNEIHARTTNGGVKGIGINASIFEGSAVNGGVELALSAPLEASDSIEMETVNGGIELDLPSESKATIAARCVNGGVRVENLDLNKETQQNEFDKRRRLNGTMNGGGAKVNLSTTNGGVRIGKTGEKSTT
ncbi:MAG: hypothetical protein K2Y23_07360 [Cyanobacteria bacterium]|nr:hypothetical protein [Cyanobacteriota bacterium]